MTRAIFRVALTETILEKKNVTGPDETGVNIK